MKIDKNYRNEIVISELYSGIVCETSGGQVVEELGICQRDRGFEITYFGKIYQFKDGTFIPPVSKVVYKECEMIVQRKNNEN